MAKRVITERDVQEAQKKGMKSLGAVVGSTIVTPAARDAAKQYGIELLDQPDSVIPATHTVQNVELLRPSNMHQPNADIVIALGSDHGGFSMKEQLKKILAEHGYSIADVGTHSDAACDYPDFAFAVASLVSSKNAARGIMIDAVGVASAMVANKVPGVRAAVGFSELAARSSREHNDANVLTLGGKVLGAESAKAIVNVWLDTWFGGGRHAARVQKITDVEKRFSK